MILKNKPAVGVEIEQVYANAETGSSFGVSDDFFARLEEIHQTRGEATKLHHIGEVSASVDFPLGNSGLDNARNLGESAIGPISPEDGGLQKLDETVRQELKDISQCLDQEGGMIINMSNHPTALIDKDAYSRLKIKKPLYDYLNDHRSVDHMQGINAKAQNSPSTGVSIHEAVDAVNTIMGAGAVFIALFANSPIEQGKINGYQENRLRLWEAMFNPSISAGDRRLYQLPAKPFRNLSDYFHWMFAPDTKMYFSVGNSSDYKKAPEFITVDGNPSLLEFLTQPQWKGTNFQSGQAVTVTPSMKDVELHQFAQFSAARIRYQLDSEFAVTEFLEAVNGPAGKLEQLLDQHTASCYIEGRDPGANFADQQLAEQAEPEVARSVSLSAAALQFGLLQNLSEAKKVINSYAWADLAGLRDAAIKDGLRAEYNGISTRKLAEELITVANTGLPDKLQRLLGYPYHVIESGQNGADRALQLLETMPGQNLSEQINNLIKARRMVLI